MEKIFENGDVGQVKEFLNNGWVIPVSYSGLGYIQEYSSPLLTQYNNSDNKIRK